MQDRRREQSVWRVGTVVAAGALCSTELPRAPEQSSTTDHSCRTPTAAQRKTSIRNIYIYIYILENKVLPHKTRRQKTRQREGEQKSDQINMERR